MAQSFAEQESPPRVQTFGETARTATTFQSGFAKLNTRSRVNLGENLTPNADEDKPKTTVMQTASTFVTTIIGVGILGFPATFAKAGWVLGSIILALCAWAVTHIGYLLEASTASVEKRMDAGEEFEFGTEVAKYDDLAQATFGKPGKIFSGIAVNGYMLLLCGAFVILIGDSLNVLTGWDKDIATIATGCVFLPISLVDNMTIIANLSVIGVIAGIIYALAIGTAGIQAALWDPSWLDEPVEHTILFPIDFVGLGSVVAVMLLGFTYQIVANTVRADMLEKTKMPEAAGMAVVVCTFVYGAAGVLAYYGFGNAVKGNVTLSMVYPANMPDVGGQNMLAGQVLSGAVIANLLVTFPILLNCVSRATEAAFIGKYNPFVRLVLVTTAIVVGYFLPYFFEFLTLVGALVGAPVSVFLPVFMYWKTAEELPMTMKLQHALILTLGSIAFIFGTIDAIQGFIDAINP